MHASSMENMQACLAHHLPAGFFDGRPRRVLDVGSADVNGSYRRLVAGPGIEYIGLDLAAGPGVDVVLKDPYAYPFEDASFDLVLSGQAFEHTEFFWLAAREMARVLRPQGTLVLIVPAEGSVHRFPVDCYRFHPDGVAAIARWAGLHVHALWQDERGPWRDVVAVLRHGPAPGAPEGAPPPAPPQPIDQTPMPSAFELVRGRVTHEEALAWIHRVLEPRGYAEIGVADGASLRLAAGPRLGIDPFPHAGVSPVVVDSSDRFFARGAPGLPTPLDLAFIDGLHHADQALRDFMHFEQRMHPAGIIVIDDIYPNLPEQATRQRQSDTWTGDVWKVLEALRFHRPDLVVIPLDCAAAGMAIVAGLDPGNRTLWDRYNDIVAAMEPERPPPRDVLQRTQALQPADARVAALLQRLQQVRSAPDPSLAARGADQVLAPWRTTRPLVRLRALAAPLVVGVLGRLPAWVRKATPRPARRAPGRSLRGRTFDSVLSPEALAGILSGTMQTTYRGREFLKSPLDQALYRLAVERSRPRTILEVGTKQGGSALWFADLQRQAGLAANVVTVDVDPPADLGDPSIQALRGDALRLGEALPADVLAALPHPWIVTEDSAHRFETTLAVLRHVHPFLVPGDLVAVEDGIVAQLPGPEYAWYEDGPNRAVAAFLEETGGCYEIAVDLCDRFGHNATFNPNGWLRRVPES